MTRINILYTRVEGSWPDSQYQTLLNLLPIDQIERNQRFIRWQDRHSHLVGRLLLRSALDMLNLGGIELSELKYNQYNRPLLEGGVDFNISHSGEYIICGIGENLKLGIDIEKIQQVDFTDFKKVMTNEQWQEINNSEIPHQIFFKYWTIKESVIKADSRGLSIPLLDLHLRDGKVCYDNNVWYIQELNIDNDYCGCLATDVEKVDISIKRIDFYH